VHQDWTSNNCQYLALPIPHLTEFKHHECPCKHFDIDDLRDHLHSCAQHAGATMGAREHVLTALQRLFTKAGYRTERKNVPDSRGMKKADLLIEDFKLAGIWHVIIDVTLRHEFHGSYANLQRHPMSTAHWMPPSGRSSTITNMTTMSATFSPCRQS
jgi:hypothetical protein